MKGLIFAAGLLFGALSMSTAITQNQIDELVMTNLLFDLLHKGYDQEINKFWGQQKHNMKVLNAQFLSRYGFTIEEMKDKETEVLDAIDQRVQEIGDSECIEAARLNLETAVTDSHTNMSATIQDVFVHFNKTNDAFFYPDVEIFHFQSNSFQWEVLNALLDINPVSDMDGLIQRIISDYFVVLQLFLNASETLEKGIREFDQEFNLVRASTFAAFESFRDAFFATSNEIQAAVAECT